MGVKCCQTAPTCWAMLEPLPPGDEKDGREKVNGKNSNTDFFTEQQSRIGKKQKRYGRPPTPGFPPGVTRTVQDQDNENNYCLNDDNLCL